MALDHSQPKNRFCSQAGRQHHTHTTHTRMALPAPLTVAWPETPPRNRAGSLKPVEKHDLCRAFFKSIDVDNDGGVSVVEFVRALKDASARVKAAGFDVLTNAPYVARA